MYKKWRLPEIWKSKRGPRINFENCTIQLWSNPIGVKGIITVILSGLYFDHRVYERGSFMWLWSRVQRKKSASYIENEAIVKKCST